ncbi:MAG: hypothetical protein ACREXU_11005 [Gammaproteobacteria bacterium]
MATVWQRARDLAPARIRHTSRARMGGKQTQDGDIDEAIGYLKEFKRRSS